MERRTQAGYEYHSCDFMDDGVYIDMNLLRDYEDTGLTPERIRELLAEARRRCLAVEGDVLEWYPVDNRYTVDAGEFVTRLQVKVRPER